MNPTKMFRLTVPFGALCAGVLLLAQFSLSARIQTPAAAPAMKHLLVIADAHTGYHHDSTSHAVSVIERLGYESGAYAATIQTDSQLITKTKVWGTGDYSPTGTSPSNAKNLTYFDAIFFFGSGELDLTSQQKADLLSFVHDDGKGFIGTHASHVAMRGWREKNEMLGGYENEDFPKVEMPIVVEDPSFPGMNAFPRSFVFTDEFPNQDRSLFADKVHVLMRLDASKLSPKLLADNPNSGKEFPIAWAKTYGKGRVYYSSFGHWTQTWDDPRVQKMYLEAIKWAMGSGKADVTPQPLPAPAK